MIEGRYPVSKSTGRCAAREVELEPGVSCVATLSEMEGEGLKRLDYSQEAWDEGTRPEGLFSFWKTVVPDRDAPKNQLVDDHVLVMIFEQLADDDTPRRVALRFVLALILMRKRLLRFLGRREDDAAVIWLMRPKGSPPDAPPVEVIDPGLGDDDVLALSEQLSEVLESDL
ncbi:MAG: hypothetical protein CMJ39_10860 [Phycisphaerae bacterium]|nr:hypothetical protein [Phycisphaerae bacterium]|tara:strand:- start:1099 stop:1611 length:513 start_codon:yes stop_codon:yes gene_type:complete